jgi:SAM-dependent methyltransferase
MALRRFAALGSELKFRLNSSWRYHCRWVADRVLDRRLDREFGIVSSDRRSLTELGIQSPDSRHYQPVSYDDFRALLNAIPISDRDVLLDLGAGMGRAVCLAAQYPFRSIIGVEISRDLCTVARQNVERIKPKLYCQDVQIVNANAMEYEIPGNVSVIYFFNSFSGPTLATVLNNIEASLRRAPRGLLFLFYGTASSEEFRQEAKRYGWVSLRSEIVLPTGAVGLIYVNCEHRGNQ